MKALVLLVLCAQGCAACSRPAAPILTWHGLGHGADPFMVPPENFVDQLDLLRDHKTVSLHDLVSGAPLPPKPVVLTFDDGTEDAYTVALPELKKRGQRAAFFVVTGFLGADEAHRRVDGGVRYLIWPEVKALKAAGMEIGSHSVDHERLSTLSEEKARAELVDSKAALEKELGGPVDLLAWPFNAVSRKVKAQAIEAGYAAAVAGEVHGSADLHSLYRIGVYQRTTLTDLRAALEKY